MLYSATSTPQQFEPNSTLNSSPTCLEQLSYTPLVRLYSRLHKPTLATVRRVKVGPPEIIALLRVITLPAAANELSPVLAQVQEIAASSAYLLNAA